MDVKALYTNIPKNEVIALILTLYNFIFNSKFYFQIKGCAMGTICAPTYANILMFEFVERYIYPLIKNKSSSYLRFIDDIFMVWTKSENERKSFINKINKKHYSIKSDSIFQREN